MKKYFIWSGIFILLTIFFIWGWHHYYQKETVQPVHQITYQITPGKNDGYGYRIYVDNQLYILQDEIPALPGLASFKSEADARKVAELMISKMETEQLPTVTREELKALGISE